MSDPVETSEFARAVSLLRAGALVAFPTETVYGLGCDARSEEAIARLYAVKGRPTSHPVIVHVASHDALDAWGRDPSDAARLLAARFWPGPLTLVVKKRQDVLDAITGGTDTVGVRVPAHPVALALLRAFGGGLAAPSANRFGRVSPTTAQHVRDDLGDDVALVLDGGATDVGVESTVVDVSSAVPAILRPGGVSRAALEAALGHAIEVRVGGDVRAPGTLASHYAPRAAVRVVQDAAELARAEDESIGLRVACVAPPGMHARSEVLARPESPEALAKALYALLREADARGLDVLLVVAPSEEGLGLAVRDRLARASAPRG